MRHISNSIFFSFLYIKVKDNFRYKVALGKTDSAATEKKNRQWTGKCNGMYKAMEYDVIQYGIVISQWFAKRRKNC